MAWYRNFYHCTDCGTHWQDEWSCCCDDECPVCGSRNWSPYESEDLSKVISETEVDFVVMVSPESADDRPRYAPVARFSSHDQAMQFMLGGGMT